MAEVMKDRKDEERDLHDRLRGELVEDPHYNTNKKFYSISDSNNNYVKKWLAERCKGKKVLDYCCGNGGSSLWLAKAGAYVHGIDISPVSIQNAITEAERMGVSDKATFWVMDAEAMDFPDETFDLAFESGVLHHLELNKAYSELARVLKPTGRVICTEALRHNIFFHTYRKMTPHLRSEWEVDHILGKKEIELAKSYFEEVEVARFFHLATLAAVPFRNTSVFKPIQRGLELVDSVLLNLPGLKWQAWMAVFVLSKPKKAADSITGD